MIAPQISIIMPAYQPRALWLDEAAASVLEQKGPELELIVVDDGSPEPVQLPSDDGRLRVIRIQHSGVSAARNAGIAEASGNWMRFVDSDDVLTSDSNSALLLGAKDGAQVVVGATEYCGTDLTPTSIGSIAEHEDMALACLRGRLDTQIGAMLIHRDVVSSAGAFDTGMRVMEDFDFALQTLAAAKSRTVSDVVYRYRRHAGSATGRATARDADDAWQRVVNRFLRQHPHLDTTDLRRELQALRNLDAANGHAASGDAAKVFLSIISAAGSSPLLTAQSLPRLLAQLALAVRRPGDG